MLVDYSHIENQAYEPNWSSFSCADRLPSSVTVGLLIALEKQGNQYQPNTLTPWRAFHLRFQTPGDISRVLLVRVLHGSSPNITSFKFIVEHLASVFLSFVRHFGVGKSAGVENVSSCLWIINQIFELDSTDAL